MSQTAVQQSVPEMDRFSSIRSRLWEKLGVYMDDSQIQFVFRAYQFAARAHEGQTRQSGIPYICHPIAVAEILADLHLDAKTISAAIMHDVIEDTQINKHELAQHFGNDVAEMVDGVSKLAQVKFTSQMEKEATNLRKMLMAMTQDVRIIIIKLGDRLHNMQTLDALPSEKQRRIARETLDIYAPIANRLGMNELRLELERLGFMYLYPDRYRVLSEAVDRVRGNRQDIIEKIETELQDNLKESIPQVKVLGRQKHLYSLYKKMRFKHLNFGEVLDVYAFRIIVKDVMECYQALGIIHSLYNPIPGKFKDYIALPKSNGYQSLHTILVGPHGVPIEVQIRTREMDNISEHGLAAHWSYKQGSDHSGAQRRAREWLRQLLENQKTAGTPTEFLENIKIDLFPDEVYVFTPKGRVITLPYGATPIDFAYAIHSQVGNHCIGALVDHEEVSLVTQLVSGQQIEIITDKNSRPDPDWLNFVATARARNQIRHALKTLEKDEVIALGKRLMQTTLKQYHTSLHEFGREQIQSLLKEMDVQNIEALYEKIGSGRMLAPIVCRILFENNDAQPQRNGFRNMLGHLLPGWLKSKPRPEALTIQGTEGMAIRFAGCCQPIPGDPIRGLITSGRGIVIHTDDCKNVKAAKKDKGAWVTVRWDEQPKREFPVTIRTHINNKRGTLATVAAAISEMEANIENVEIQQKNAKISTTEFTISVRHRKHLAQIIRHIRSLDCVRQVFRVKH